MHRGLAAFGVTAAATLAVAQLGSYLVQARLPLHETYVVTAVVHFTHIQNTGGVFGLFPGHVRIFAVTSGLTMIALGWYLWRHRTLRPFQFVCFGLIAGAAGSNVCDRILYGAVIDFIDIQGVPYWRYIFNLADVAIHLGAWPLAVSAIHSSRAGGPTE